MAGANRGGGEGKEISAKGNPNPNPTPLPYSFRYLLRRLRLSPLQWSLYVIGRLGRGKKERARRAPFPSSLIVQRVLTFLLFCFIGIPSGSLCGGERIRDLLCGSGRSRTEHSENLGNEGQEKEEERSLPSPPPLPLLKYLSLIKFSSTVLQCSP